MTHVVWSYDAPLSTRDMLRLSCRDHHIGDDDDSDDNRRELQQLGAAAAALTLMLPPGERDIVRALDMRGMTASEYARRHRVSCGYVCHAQQRGERWLRDILSACFPATRKAGKKNELSKAGLTTGGRV